MTVQHQLLAEWRCFKIYKIIFQIAAIPTESASLNRRIIVSQNMSGNAISGLDSFQVGKNGNFGKNIPK